MFSVLSRLSKPNNDAKKTTPAPMSSSLQKKFSKGVHYNMKILIKGDRNVGKSCLLQRLQGGPFIEDYRPTDQIQAAPINWAYRDSGHIVKVEVWEVVDKAQAKKKSNLGLKLENATPNSQADMMETPQLDATFLDVYKNANGVILMLDITKPWTFDYVQRELVGIPGDIPVIILGNHCDMHHHRQVHPHQIEHIMETQNRSGSVRYAEASMRNGFGLRLLHKFLSVPFLQLQRCTFLAQLATNQNETEQAHQELDLFQNSEEADYNTFLERLAQRRKQEASGTIPVMRHHHDKSPSIVLGGGKPIIPPNINPLASSTIGLTTTKPFLGNLTSGGGTKSGSQTTTPQGNAPPVQNPATCPGEQRESVIPPITSGVKSANDLDDFFAGDLDHSFLDDMSPTSKTQPVAEYVPNIPTKPTLDSDSDEEAGANPLVVKIPDDLESDEDVKKQEYTRQSPAELAFSIQENISKNVSKTAKVLQLNPIVSEPPPVKSYVSTENIFTPYRESSQLKMDSSVLSYEEKMVESVSETNIFSNMDKLSVYSDDKKTLNSDEETYDSGPELVRSNTYNPTPMWPIDTGIRRSPEGGEDVTPDAEVKKDKKSKEEKKHKKSKKSKDKERSGDKERRRDKEKDKDTEKEKKHKEKKQRKKDSNEYLEEFLNGSTSAAEPAQEAYETL